MRKCGIYKVQINQYYQRLKAIHVLINLLTSRTQFSVYKPYTLVILKTHETTKKSTFGNKENKASVDQLSTSISSKPLYNSEIL